MNIVELLNKTKPLLQKRNQEINESGEGFNIFSILGVAHYENTTHSAFLAELLNPAGSHGRGTLFLRLFLSTLSNTKLDPNTTQVKLEHHIGAKNADSGGRVDIYLYDNRGNSICIENKIYAADQENQILRYYKYNKSKNQVYYLTLNGDEASGYSKGILIENVDYFPIAYKTEIIEWLFACKKEVEQTPIIRESINQYIILIKKLTNTVDMEKDKELIALMLNHFEESEFIATEFTKYRNNTLEAFRQEVYKQLKASLPNSYEVELANNTSKTFSNIWIKLKNHTKEQLYFGIEGFNAKLFIGIRDDGNKKLNYGNQPDNMPNGTMWTNLMFLEFENKPIDFNSKECFNGIAQNEEYKIALLNSITTFVVKYVEVQNERLNEFLNKSKGLSI
jgi:hypothetical protein